MELTYGSLKYGVDLHEVTSLVLSREYGVGGGVQGSIGRALQHSEY